MVDQQSLAALQLMISSGPREHDGKLPRGRDNRPRREGAICKWTTVPRLQVDNTFPLPAKGAQAPDAKQVDVSPGRASHDLEKLA
eukprot:2790051-Alexandrium_andersonii.AAC.1